MTIPKYVYDFAQGNRFMADLLGGKVANLGEMIDVSYAIHPVAGR